MQAGNPRRVLSQGRALSWERALLCFSSTSGALWGPDPTAAPTAGPPSPTAWPLSSTRKHTPEKSPPDLRPPCQSQPPCPQARKVRQRPPVPQGAVATGKGKAPKVSQKTSPICALSVETALQKSQPSSSTGAATLASPCERVWRPGTSLLRGTLEPPKIVGKGGQPYQCREVEENEPWEKTVFLHWS